MEKTIFSSLTEEQRQLVNAAEKAMDTAYAPYSKYHVGAALVTTSGQIITGSNVENAAYGSTICAERAAILRANAEGHREFKALAVIAKNQVTMESSVSSPCGACRQMIFEAAQLSGCDLPIILSDSKKENIILTTINELLPMGFGPVDLGIDVQKYRPSTKTPQ